MQAARCSAKRRRATSVEQARKLVALVEGKQAVFQVSLQRRASAIYRQAAAMVQTGMLGRITAVQCEWCRNNNWRRPMPVPRGHADFGKLNHQLNWRLFRDTSQGLMAELGAHQLDVANWFLGTPPKRVFATGGIDYWCDGREVFDNNRQRIGRHARRTCVVRRTCPAHGSCDDLIGMRRPRQRDDDPHGQ